jgi:hypothetical protein
VGKYSVEETRDAMKMPSSAVRGDLLVLLVAVLLSVMAAEVFLRYRGYAPGKHTPNQWFSMVDTLWVKEGFMADSLGIFRISDQAKSSVWQMMERDSFLHLPNQSSEAFCNARDALQLKRGEVSGELETAYRKAKLINQSQRSDWQQAVVALVDSALNPDGFRSIPFRRMVNDKPSILLLGDSFTYGFSASSLYNSFADLLLARGYTVYNSGITGTDIAQYLAIAEHYLPILNPDIVIANVFLGNDIVYHERTVCPGCPVFFPSNAGNLVACPHGITFKSPQEAYEHSLHNIYIQKDAGLLAQLMSLSSMTSALWGVLWNNGFVNYHDSIAAEYYRKVAANKRNPPFCRNELQRIDSTSTANGARCIISVIPEVGTDVFRTVEDFPRVFSGLEYVQMEVGSEDYVLSNGHFNDRGHRRYADFLQKLIDEQ